MKRPRFSLRTLAIVVTLICAYLGAWEATKKYGVTPPSELNFGYERHWGDADFVKAQSKSPFPLIVWEDEMYNIKGTIIHPRMYYLWLFGPRIKLPIESTW